MPWSPVWISAVLCACSLPSDRAEPTGTSDRDDVHLSLETNKTDVVLPPTLVMAPEEPDEIPAEYLTPSHTKTVTIPRGQTVYLHCNVHKMSERTVSWIRLRDFHLITVGGYTYSSDSRYQIVKGKTPDDYVLQLKYPQPSDEGLYECQVEAEPSLSTYVYLRVVVPRAKIAGGPDLYVEAGSDINLTCTISQSPDMPAFVFWFHDDRMINYDSRRRISLNRLSLDRVQSSLLIRDAQLAYSGNYTCSSSNAEPVTVLVHVVKGEQQVAVQHDARQPIVISSAPSQRASLLLIHVILLLSTGLSPVR